MALTDNMDSVFDMNTESELDFDVMFDEEDSLIDTVNGVSESGDSLLGEDVDLESLEEAEDFIGDKLDDVSTDNDDNKVDIEGTKDKKPEYGGEGGTSGIEKTKNSAERNSYGDETPKSFKEGDDMSDEEDADLDDEMVDESFLDPDDYLLDESAPEVPTDSVSEAKCEKCGKNESDCTCGEGKEKTDDGSLDESFLDPDDYLLDESDAPKNAEGTGESELDKDALVDKEEKAQESAMFSSRPFFESDEIDYAEDEIIDAVDDNNETGDAGLEYDAEEDEAILDELL